MTEILILSRSDLRQLISFSDYVDVVADAFQLLAQGQCQSPVPTEIREDRGTFHIKPGSLPRGAGYVAVKINGNFPSNRASCGLPTIQGAVYLADSSNGRPLALLDSMEITVQRTGAATAIAARYLARPNATTAAICGCGEQAAIQLAGLRHVLHLRRVFAWDVDRQAARNGSPIAGLIARGAGRAFAGFAKRMGARRTIAQLSALDDRTLHDIGLHRSEIASRALDVGADPPALLLSATC
jgi:ornithine cyclodeaminase/alanine dehydrogenase-like protein (mu-crystallin family)